ncbi:MAG: SRPBCC domain-containing protein [Anaerolineae bacterium]
MTEPSDAEKAITAQIQVPAPLPEVWKAWTTEEGAQSFFAPRCRIDLKPGGAYEMLFDLEAGRIDLKPGGAYEMLFDLEAEPGKRGGEGMVVMAVQPERMLAFTWNAPPHLSTVRGQRTHVVVRLFETEAGGTRVLLRHDGWGEGEEWEEAFEYFTRAWRDVVLPRLRVRFARGPIDWSHPPALDERGERSG